jgi:hypothetical protein
MERNGKDALIEEIDKELRAIDARLKKVISKTDALLKEAFTETEEAEAPSGSENAGDADQASE